MLNNLSAILDKAEAYAGTHKIDPEVLLNYQLAPDSLVAQCPQQELLNLSICPPETS
jgi:hypothetical protein